MSHGLIGHTGFVGGTLARQHRFDACFNSKNVEEVAGREFEFLAVSAMPAAMWVANRDPAADRAVLERLIGCLRRVEAARVVVVSTVAVYPDPLGPDESTPIDPAAQTAYGRHRLMLEHFAADHFPRATCIRLPGLFGHGLKKNAVYDLLHDNETHKVHARSVYQFYSLDRLWADVSAAAIAGLRTVNFATEPVSVAEVAREAFGLDFHNDPGTQPARYDVRTGHAAVFGGCGEYLCDKTEVLGGLRAFVAGERRAAAA